MEMVIFFIYSLCAAVIEAPAPIVASRARVADNLSKRGSFLFSLVLSLPLPFSGSSTRRRCSPFDSRIDHLRWSSARDRESTRRNYYEGYRAARER